jgi:hypothetical protein
VGKCVSVLLGGFEVPAPGGDETEKEDVKKRLMRALLEVHVIDS